MKPVFRSGIGLVGAVALLLLSWGGAAAAGSDYPTFNFNAQRSGVNPSESAIKGSTVGALHKLWAADLEQPADSSAIFLSGIQLADGSTHDLVYVTTKRGVTYAFEAHSGQQVWKAAPNAGQLRGYQITTATPAADPSRQWLYAPSPDGKIRRYSAASGQETLGGGWPVPVSLMPDVEKISSALNVANGYLYVTTSGYNGDFGPYNGHVVAIKLTDASTTVFNTLCSDVHQLIGRATQETNSCGARESGVWSRGGAVVDQSGGPATGVVYISTGNGPYNGATHFGDSVLALSPDVSVNFGSFTPTNFAELDASDTDLGSSAPAILPQQPQSHTPWMAVVGGKDGILRLIDRARMGGLGADIADLHAGIGRLLPQPAVWQDGNGLTWLFAAGDNGLAGVQVTTDANGATKLKKAWMARPGMSSPMLAGNVLFAAQHNGMLRAFDPQSGAELWSSAAPAAGGGVSGVHWQSPIVTSGMLFMPDEAGHLAAYGL